MLAVESAISMRVSEWAEADGHSTQNAANRSTREKKEESYSRLAQSNRSSGLLSKRAAGSAPWFLAWLWHGVFPHSVCRAGMTSRDPMGMLGFPPLGRGFLVQRVPRVTFARALDGQSKRWDLSENRCGGERLVVVLFRSLFERWLVKIMTILRRLRPGLAD